MKKNPFISFIVCLFALILGVGGGAVGITYATMPETEELVVGEEVYYTYNGTGVSNVPLDSAGQGLSVHFLELGNKYTGDCTYIKYGDVDILIDCGSKSSSISTVSEYLKTYMGEDNKIDYCIVTHAHTDHYAGFATGTKVQGIYDLFDFGTIIDFGSATNKDKDSGMLKKYIDNRDDAIERCDAEYFDVSVSALKGNNKIYNIGANNEVQLEILYNRYYNHKINGTENNYSVCVMLKFDDKEFLFTGDLEEHGSSAETYLLEDNESLKDIANSSDGVELYKAGHHGSSTSSSKNFIDAIKPEVVCVCCCAGSPEYTDDVDKMFPTTSFIETIAPHTQDIFVTSLCVDWKNDEYTSMNGNIVVIAIAEQEKLGINCSNNDQILRKQEWFNRTITVDGIERAMRTWPPNGVVID
ncbi:MAG: MBL fold metallo-hydrolase [Clostridia bacterium]|nr:MBL fold metallo-hydrolase [Clostridia bacterium]